MIFGIAITVFAAGIVLLIAVSGTVAGMSVNAAGAIMMIVGALLALIALAPGRPTRPPPGPT